MGEYSRKFGIAIRPARLAARLAFLPLLSGCTHLETAPDRLVTARRSQALPGPTYSLPMLQYEVGVARLLTKCPTQLDLADAGADSGEYWVDGLAIQLSATATPQYIPGERYRVDYSRLDGWFKTTAFTIEYQKDSDILKSVNVSVEDHTGEAIGSAVKAGLAAVAVASGPAGALAVGGLATAVTSEAQTAGAGFVDPQAKVEAARRESARSHLLRVIAQSSERRPLLTCNDDTYALVANRQKALAQMEVDQKGLDELTQGVDALTKLANAKALNASQRDRLVKATTELSTKLAAMADAKAAVAKVEASLGTTGSDRWPRRFTDRALEPVVPLGSGALRKLAELLDPVPQLSRVVRPHVLANLLAADAELPALRTYFPKFVKAFVTDGGLPRYVNAPVPVDGCSAGTLSPAACVASLGAVSAALQPVASDMLPPCAAADREDAECLRTYPDTPTDAQRRWLPRIVDARANAPSRGIYVRPPGRGKLLVCRPPSSSERADTNGCAEGQSDLIKDDRVLAPQLGQLRYFTLDNEAFSNNALVLVLDKDGRIEKFSYSTTKSIAQGLAATAADAATQAAAFDKARRAEYEANTDPLVPINKQVALKKAQVELATLNAPAVVYPTAEQTATTKALNDEIAYLTAQRTVIEARRALAATGP